MTTNLKAWKRAGRGRSTMKRFVLSYTEEKILEELASEYRDARQGRDRAKALLAKAEALPPGWKKDFDHSFALENLAVEREAIRLITNLTNILRRF